MTIEGSRESIKVSGPELLEKAKEVLSDVDGILYHPHKEAVSGLKRRLVQRFGKGVDLNFSHSQIARYRHLSEWAEERGFSPEEALEFENTLWDSRQVLENGEAIDGAQELILWLIKEKQKKVKAHTSRPPETAEITKDFLKKVSKSKEEKIPLSIRWNKDMDRHMFKAISATAEAANYGRILVLEDMSSHALNILTYADHYDADVWVLLVPYGMAPVPMEVLAHPRLICIERKSEDQGIRRVHRYLKGEPI